MFTRILKYWRSRPPEEEGREGLDALLVERQRLGEMIALYDEFGYGPMAERCRTQRFELNRRIRKFLSRRPTRSTEPE